MSNERDFLEQQGLSDESIDDILEHFGVRGQKWGVRRKTSRDSRTKRLNSGTATLRDKLIRDADLDGGNKQMKDQSVSNFMRGETFKKKGTSGKKSKPMSSLTSNSIKIGLGVAGGLLAVNGLKNMGIIKR